ncbi:MAG TPA: branched-chain amino acid ABC transporter permease [Anaeromyxobacteraceae bacterium]|nr:branched-chain amino acid ABC transporter permease [Anaeromyxobacteraceae bacterium]
MSSLRLFARSLLPFAVALPVLLILQGALSGAAQSRASELAGPIAIISMVAGINVILAVSLNVVNGFTGQFSLGHAGFMAVGAYTAAKITMSFRGLESAGLSGQALFLFALFAGMVTSALTGLIVGVPSLRLRGDYLAIVTLGFNEIILVLIRNTRYLGQATGLSGLPKYTSFAWVGMAVLVTVVMAKRLALSTHGRALLAIREDEVAAEAMGVDTTGYKVRSFVIASAFAGLAGGLLVHLLQLCTPPLFTFSKSIEVVGMVVLGGMGSVTGSVVSAVVLSLALEGLRSVKEFRMVGYSILLIALMLARPTGLFGVREIWDLWPGRRRAKSAGVSP